MSGSGGQRDKAAVCGVPVCWPWVPMSGGRLGSSRLASSGVLPGGEGGGDEACAIPGAQFDGLVAEELGRWGWPRRWRWIRTVGRARPRGFRGRQAGRQGAGLRAAGSAATIGQGSPGCSFLARARLFPWQSQGVMMALGDQYLAMQGSAWRRTDVGLVELWLVKVLGSRSGRMMAFPALPGSAARRTRRWGSRKRRVRPPRGPVSRLRTGRA